MIDRNSDSYKLGEARAALTKAHYLAQAARRAMRDHGGAEEFLDLNAAVAEFQSAYDALRGESTPQEKTP
jgi:hypothetical protein